MKSSDASAQADAPDSQALPQRFEEAVAELEAIVSAMESGKLSLEDSLARFQRGSQLLRHCRDTLESAEQRLHIVQDGVSQPFTIPGQDTP